MLRSRAKFLTGDAGETPQCRNRKTQDAGLLRQKGDRLASPSRLILPVQVFRRSLLSHRGPVV